MIYKYQSFVVTFAAVMYSLLSFIADSGISWLPSFFRRLVFFSVFSLRQLCVACTDQLPDRLGAFLWSHVPPHATWYGLAHLHTSVVLAVLTDITL